MVALRWCSQENEGGGLPLSDNGHTLFPIIAVLLVDNSSLLGGGQAEVMTSPSSVTCQLLNSLNLCRNQTQFYDIDTEINHGSRLCFRVSAQR